jgi:hypothetical protein
MRQPFHTARLCALAGLLAACAVAQAQTMNDSTVAPAVAKKQKQEIKKGDPARWYKADNSRQGQVRNKEKEIAAAFREEKAACRKVGSAERSRCLKDARVTYEHDMSHVRTLVSNAPVGGVMTTVTTAVQPGGAESMGSSQGGATQGGGDQGMRGSQGGTTQGAGEQGTGNQGAGNRGTGNEGTQGGSQQEGQGSGGY